MRIRYFLPIALTAFAASVPVIKWKTGDRSRPLPVMVTPGEPSTQQHAGTAPSDAVQLFNGTDLSAWQQHDGKPIAGDLVHVDGLHVLAKLIGVGGGRVLHACVVVDSGEDNG